MIEANTLARPYAKAAFSSAQEKKEAEQWSNALATLAAIVKAPEMADVLRDPKLGYEQLAEILEGCVPELNAEMKNFVQTLAYNRRLQLLPSILELFDQYRAEAEKTINVKIASAFPMNDEQRARFTALLSKKLDRQVHVDSTTDETLIGGVIIRAGDQVIDGSVRGRLTELADSLMNG